MYLFLAKYFERLSVVTTTLEQLQNSILRNDLFRLHLLVEDREGVTERTKHACVVCFHSQERHPVLSRSAFDFPILARRHQAPHAIQKHVFFLLVREKITNHDGDVFQKQSHENFVPGAAGQLWEARAEHGNNVRTGEVICDILIVLFNANHFKTIAMITTKFSFCESLVFLCSFRVLGAFQSVISPFCSCQFLLCSYRFLSCGIGFVHLYLVLHGTLQKAQLLVKLFGVHHRNIVRMPRRAQYEHNPDFANILWPPAAEL
mmetsp:Transcript_138130/g.240249  ORF Transcript_138130/g.240249 Transcript_138130/m.240249 type:complete len:261 (-) Transcript_138130:409-1191(-)